MEVCLPGQWFSEKTFRSPLDPELQEGSGTMLVSSSVSQLGALCLAYGQHSESLSGQLIPAVTLWAPSFSKQRLTSLSVISNLLDLSDVVPPTGLLVPGEQNTWGRRGGFCAGNRLAVAARALGPKETTAGWA